MFAYVDHVVTVVAVAVVGALLMPSLTFARAVHKLLKFVATFERSNLMLHAANAAVLIHLKYS